MKGKVIGFRLHRSRAEKLKRIADTLEKTMTQLLEDWIDALPEPEPKTPLQADRGNRMTNPSTLPPAVLNLLSALTENMPPACILNRLSSMTLADMVTAQAFMRDEWDCGSDLLDQEIVRRGGER